MAERDDVRSSRFENGEHGARPGLATAARAVLTARDRLADEGDTLEVRLAMGDAMAGLRAALADEEPRYTVAELHALLADAGHGIYWCDESETSATLRLVGPVGVERVAEIVARRGGR